MGFWRWLGRRARRAGYELVPMHHTTHGPTRLARLLAVQGVDEVFDVGANSGRYGRRLRAAGYRGRIVSFEPLSAPLARLRETAARDGAWEVVAAALGERDGEAEINVAGNVESSSFLPMLPRHLESAPHSAYVGTEKVAMITLATALARHARPASRLLLKLDVQGYEWRILRASAASLDRVACLQVEAALVPLYEGEALIEEMFADLRRRGLVPAAIDPAHSDPETGQLLQADCLFLRPA